LLVHGGMDRGRGFARTARHLEGLDVSTYDRRGYERSSGLETSADLDVQVDDLLAVIGQCAAVVVGHSFGGLVALVAAQRHPELVAAVGAFEAPRPWRAGGDGHALSTPGDLAVEVARRDGTRAAGEAFMRAVIGDSMWERLPEPVQQKRRSEGAALVADVDAAHGAGVAYRDDAFVVPVVVGRGTRSSPALAAAADDLAASVPGAELVVVDGADHGAHLSRPRGFADFVRRVVAAARHTEPPITAG
jgi:pimeloyl-ACP methyl ester carboxylesterase